jgi:hypothetical protein
MVLNYYATCVSIRSENQFTVQKAFEKFLATLHEQNGVRTWSDSFRPAVEAYETFRQSVAAERKLDTRREETTGA